MSASLLIFIITHTIAALAIFPYMLYLIVFWSATDGNGKYDPYVLFWTGMASALYLTVSGLATFFLTFDRCLLLRFPAIYQGKLKRRFPHLFATIIILMTIYIIGVYALLRLPLDVLKVQHCQSTGCVDINSDKNLIYRDIITEYGKLIISGINIILMFYFLWLLHRTSSDKRNDRIVKITIFLDVALDSAPLLIYRILITFAADSVVTIYVAQLSGLLFVLRMAICAIFYWIILLKMRNRGTVSSITEVTIRVIAVGSKNT
ncbi:hypothetical protein DdX_14320 [Ditylenchus destructor]|uniref:Uncharacterized protein n=1 Tax=Ditylenchus destructor TaxID=166010 RepID=A0AAD4MUT4_9BILA|nr:hypothetical protein DdX_14320 [Ditylenchus destructor]